MQFITTITQKGQVTIPKKMRDKAGIKPKDKVEIKQGKNGNITVSPTFTILDLIGELVPRANRNKDAIEAREEMEKNYLGYDKKLLERI